MKHSKMSEALKVLGITRHTLTLWEQALQLQIPRDENGHRVFSRDWIRYLETVKDKLNEGWDFVKLIYNLDSPSQRGPNLQTAVGPEY